MFSNAVNIPGSNPIFNYTNQGDINVVYPSSGGFKSLAQHVATGALHNSGEVSDAPKCHPGTRVTLLNSVFQWAMASAYLVCIQWIYGPAGAGKSAILRTLAEMLEKHGLLLASFFFFRSAAGRNNADYFIPTIAYQITLSIRSTRGRIERAIETDPVIFSRSLEAQAQALIILPLIQAHREGSIASQYPRIIIVDGLDECQGEGRQREVLQALNNMLLKLPIPFAIILASRPEPHIRDTFDLDLNKTSTRLALDNSYEPDKDIQKFYDDKFHQMCKRHPLRSHLPKPWPPPSVIKALVDKASGQFILPATVIKFVEPHRYNPLQRLDMIMGSISPGKLKPFEPLDNLYSTIFASLDPDDLNDVLAVLGIFLVQYSTITISWIPRLPYFTGYDETEIKRLLFDLESLIQIDQGHEHHISVRPHHASLADFLFDQHRSGRFFVSPPMVYERLTRKCIKMFSEGVINLDVDTEFPHIIRNAEPTEELIRTLKGLNAVGLSRMLKGKESLLWTLQAFLNVVLPGVSSSVLPDKDLLHAHLLAMLREVITTKVDYYFNANLAPFLVYLMELGPHRDKPRTFPNNRIYHICSDQIYPIRGDLCPVGVANQDQQNGFCLTLVSNQSDMSPAYHNESMQNFHLLVTGIIGDRAGDCYADFAIHTLNWISEFPITAVLPDHLEHIAKTLLPTLLKRSSPRSDVQHALTNNPFHPIMLGKILAYAVAIQEYFRRADAPLIQADDLHSPSNKMVQSSFRQRSFLRGSRVKDQGVKESLGRQIKDFFHWR